MIATILLASVLVVAQAHPAPEATVNVIPMKKPVEQHFHNENVKLHKKMYTRYVISKDGRVLVVSTNGKLWDPLPAAQKKSMEDDVQAWWRTVCDGKAASCVGRIDPDHPVPVNVLSPHP